MGLYPDDLPANMFCTFFLDEWGFTRMICLRICFVPFSLMKKVPKKSRLIPLACSCNSGLAFHASQAQANV
jgi:hypothetical protein